MIRTLILLGIVGAVVVVGGNQLAEAAARQAVDRALADSGVDAADVDVDLGGTFVLGQLVSGELESLQLDLDDVQVDDSRVQLEQLRADLQGVSFSPGDLIDGGTVTLTIESGSASATVSEEELRRLAQDQLERLELRVDERGVVLVGSVLGQEVEVVTEPRVSDGSLVLVPTEVGPVDLDSGLGAEIAKRIQVTVPLPELPLGATLTSAQTTSSALRLTGDLPTTLTFPEGAQPQEPATPTG